MPFLQPTKQGKWKFLNDGEPEKLSCLIDGARARTLTAVSVGLLECFCPSKYSRCSTKGIHNVEVAERQQEKSMAANENGMLFTVLPGDLTAMHDK
jgi:hypothetical protein